MSDPQIATETRLRMTVDELQSRLKRGEAATILDARNDKAWRTSPVKIAGAIRYPSAPDPSWPKDRLTVVY
ncbi:MAG TPA: hypothetical protein VJ783_17660 [Pirellulales bacterium]|nr:hypothetical protein [Pirellulales bacterium]